MMQKTKRTPHLVDPRPIATEALKALAVLTSHPIVREVLKSVPSPFARFMALLHGRANHQDIHESAVTVLGNLSACRAHAEAIANLKGLAELSVSFMSPTASPSMQSRYATRPPARQQTCLTLVIIKETTIDLKRTFPYFWGVAKYFMQKQQHTNRCGNLSALPHQRTLLITIWEPVYQSVEFSSTPHLLCSNGSLPYQSILRF